MDFNFLFFHTFLYEESRFHERFIAEMQRSRRGRRRNNVKRHYDRVKNPQFFYLKLFKLNYPILFWPRRINGNNYLYRSMYIRGSVEGIWFSFERLTPGLLFPIPGSLDFLRPVYNFTKRREIHARGSDTAFSSTVGIDKFSSGAAESKSTRVCKRCNVVTKRKFQRCRKFPLPSTRWHSS